MKNAVIVVLLMAVVLLSARLVAIENQRYAAALGICPGKLVPHIQDLSCLATVQTRTSWLWHLLYAVKG